MSVSHCDNPLSAGMGLGSVCFPKSLGAKPGLGLVLSEHTPSFESAYEFKALNSISLKVSDALPVMVTIVVSGLINGLYFLCTN